MSRRARRLPHRQRGLSYLETLVAVVMVGLMLAPALDALDGGVRNAAGHAASADRHFRLLGRMESVLAEPFAALDAEALAAGGATVATAFSDPPGTPDRLLVFLARWDADDADGDGDPLTGGDEGLVWVRVQVEGGHRSLETLSAR